MRRVFLLGSVVAWAFVIGYAAGLGTSGPAAAATAPTPVAPAVTERQPNLEQRRDAPRTTVEEVSRTVMCPSCDTTLDQSDSPSAQRMRAYVQAAVAAGWTKDEIRDGLVDQYGGDAGVLATPRSADRLGLVAWLVPGLIVTIGAVVGLVSLRRWRRARPAEPAVPR